MNRLRATTVKRPIWWLVLRNLSGIAEDNVVLKGEFSKERLKDIQVDSGTYAILLRKCGTARVLSEGQWLHNQIVRNGYEQNTYLGNLLVQMYGNCGSVKDARLAFERISQLNVFSYNIMVAAYAQNGYLQDARNVFDKMPQRDVISWNAMVAAYAQNGHGEEALGIFRQMELEGVKPNNVTLISMLDALAGLADLAEGKIIHARICGHGLDSDVVIATGLINVYGKCKAVNAAKSVFDGMPKHDVVSWTAMLAAYTQNGYLQEGRTVFERMPEANLFSWNLIIVAYAQNGHVQDAKCMFDKTLEPDVVSWNTMIGAYAQIGEGKKALKLFREMDLEGMKPNKITFLSIFEACGNLAESKMCHGSAIDCELQLDVAVGNALISMYGKCGSLQHAKMVFDTLPEPNVVSWTSIVAAYAQNGHGKEAVELSQLMDLEGMNPNNITYVSILSACSHAGLVEQGEYYFISMSKDRGIKPEMEHYRCMIDMFGRAGQLNKAEDVIKNMPISPDPVAWMTLLSACKTQVDVQRAAYAAERVLELEPKNLAPHVLVSNVCAEYWKRAVLLKQHAGLKKSANESEATLWSSRTVDCCILSSSTSTPLLE